jgi:hypothetical protein
MIDFPPQIPTDLQKCPACGAVFQWNATTGTITHYYEEGDNEEPDRRIPRERDEALEGPAEDDARSPEEVVGAIRGKIQKHGEMDEKRATYLFRRTFFIVVMLFAILPQFSLLPDLIAGRGPRLNIIGSMLWFPAIAIIPGLLAAIVVCGVDRVIQAIWHSFKEKGSKEPDLKTISDRLRVDSVVVRRPLPQFTSNQDVAELPGTSITAGDQPSRDPDPTSVKKETVEISRAPFPPRLHGGD